MENRDKPIQIGEKVWWVGARLIDDTFQCHAYFIDNGDNSVLIDPGSYLTIDSTIEKIRQISTLNSIKYLVCHHPDPDVAASLPYLSEKLTREDILVVTEWRAKALLKHYDHRFEYYLVEENNWAVQLGPDRTLQFLLTPYLHFPGAMVSYDTLSGTLFSSDLFGGFVPDAKILISHDADYIIESARPFHQHYMPSKDILSAGLGRIQQKWSNIQQIAPQHGHIIPHDIVPAVFNSLKDLDCGVFSLSDADIDLKRLLLISEAKTQITHALIAIADPGALITAMNVILTETREARDCALFIDMPNKGWMMWGMGLSKPIHKTPNPLLPTIALPCSPSAVLTIHTPDNEHPDDDLMRMLRTMADAIRPSVDQYVLQHRQEDELEMFQAAALTDPLTGAGNRRALHTNTPTGDYALLSIDIDYFKRINDTFGHAVGDDVLQTLTATLHRSIRERDSLYRVGGEEFLVVLPDSNEENAVAIAERIRKSAQELRFAAMEDSDSVTLSIGIACAKDATLEDFVSLLSHADTALYESKNNGRDRITVWVNPSRTL